MGMTRTPKSHNHTWTDAASLRVRRLPFHFPNPNDRSIN